MKIEVEYNPLRQTEALWGTFIFVKEDDGTIHNLEARF